MQRVLRLFAFGGRSRRRQYWLVGLSLNAILFGIFYVIATQGERIPWQIGLLILVAMATAALMNVALGARRLHDLGRPAWWLLLYYATPFSLMAIFAWLERGAPASTPLLLVAMIIPLIGVFDLGLRRGVEGANNYGPDPRHGVDATVFD